MSDATVEEHPLRRWMLLPASLIPLVAFMVPISFGLFTDAVTFGELGGAALFCLGAVALPTLLALVAARPGTMRVVVVVLLSVVALASGVIVATSADAQAGLVVLWIPVIALPLALILWIGRILVSRDAAT